MEVTDHYLLFFSPMEYATSRGSPNVNYETYVLCHYKYTSSNKWSSTVKHITRKELPRVYGFLLHSQLCYEHTNSATLDGSAGEGACCQAEFVSLSPRIHIVGGENRLLCGSHLYVPWYMHAYMNKYMSTQGTQRKIINMIKI